MSESRIIVSTEALARSITIWLTVVGQRRPALIRDLWTRRDERPDESQRAHARHELARFLAEQMRISSHEVTRRAIASDRAGTDLRDGE